MESGEDSSEDVAVVHLSEDDQGLAAGQFAAFYQGKTCLGSGIILESWDDQGFPICAKALEIARMEDKSLLGKPVKIKVKPETTLTEPDQKGGKQRNQGLSSRIAASKQGSQTSHEEAIPRFPMKWLQQFRQKWLRIF